MWCLEYQRCIILISCGCHNSSRESGRFTDLDMGNTLSRRARHPPLDILGKLSVEPFGDHPDVSFIISHNLLRVGSSDVVGVGL